MPSVAEVPTSCIGKKRRRDENPVTGGGGVEVQMKVSRYDRFS
jgi:hypothetical protein